MRKVTLQEAEEIMKKDVTYRKSIYYGKNGIFSVDKGQINSSDIHGSLLNILAHNPYYGLYAD